MFIGEAVDTSGSATSNTLRGDYLLMSVRRRIAKHTQSQTANAVDRLRTPPLSPPVSNEGDDMYIQCRDAEAAASEGVRRREVEDQHAC